MVNFKISIPSDDSLNVQGAVIQGANIGSLSFTTESLTGPGPLSSSYLSVVQLSATGGNFTLPTSYLSNGQVKQVYNNSSTGVAVSVNSTSPTGTLIAPQKFGNFLYYNGAWVYSSYQ